MSRMERYRHVHEESKQAKKHPIRTHREIAKQNKLANEEEFEQFENDPLEFEEEQPTSTSRVQNQSRGYAPQFRKYRTPEDNEESLPEYDDEQPLKPPKKKKTKKRKKHRLLRFVVKLLLILSVYSVVSFFIGQTVAKLDRTTSMEQETFNGFTAANGANNILLIGNDSREGEVSRADTIMVLQLDGPSKKPKLISFMRDTYVTIPGVGEDKLNAAYAYGGAELVRATLAQNFGIETKTYATVNFETFEKVIDTLFPRGVTIDAEKDMSYHIQAEIKQGTQKMDGFTLLQYARFRMDEEGDFGRVRRQQQVMDAIFSQMKNPLTLIKLPYAAGKVMGYTSTNVSMGFLLRNSFAIARGANGIDRLSVPVENSWYYGETYESGSILVVDAEMNAAAIQEFLEK